LFEGTRCVGVRYSAGDKTYEARAGREVVVCGGTINSPQLLELSGIGQPERLKPLGIEVRHALPGVGENLRDHYAPRTRWAVGAKGYTYNDTGRGLALVGQALRSLVTRKGMLASVGAPMRAFVRSREGLVAPDLLLGWVPMYTEPGARGPVVAAKSGVTCYAHPMRPESRGHIHIAAADPRRPPSINFNFLSASVDGELTVRAIRIARAIMNAKALAPLLVTEEAPGTDLQRDDEILDWVKGAAETTYHPVGTCKMGVDPMAVVDPRLRVHGIAGLRVADASIMPTLTSGNTNAPSIMIGEKAADLVLQNGGV
jgi:choline dehydrogenase